MLLGNKTKHISLRETLVLLVWRACVYRSTKTETPFECTTVSESLEVLHIDSEDLALDAVNSFASPSRKYFVAKNCAKSANHGIGPYNPNLQRSAQKSFCLEIKRNTLVYVKPWFSWSGGPASTVQQKLRLPRMHHRVRIFRSASYRFRRPGS